MSADRPPPTRPALSRTTTLFTLCLAIFFLLFLLQLPWVRQTLQLPRPSAPHPLHPVTAAFAAHGTVPSRRNIPFQEFLQETKAAFEVRRLRHRPLYLVFSDVRDVPHPDCNGLWLEFGVFTGRSINTSAAWRYRHCGGWGAVYGFDTFTGLPEQWGKAAGKGHFSLGGALPPVEQGVILVKGLFNESLPAWKRQMKDAQPVVRPITYLHIDCDLYQGAIDVLTELNDWIAPGCLLLFDELFNYPGYEQHEVKALWEWTTRFDRQVEALGKLGLPSMQGEAVVLAPEKDLGRDFQSALFVVRQ